MTERLFESALLATLLSAIWLSGVLLLRAPVARWLGARWAYALWLVPLAGLLALFLPDPMFRPESAWSGLRIPAIGSVYEALDVFVSEELTASAGPITTTTSASGFSLPRVLLGVWVAGTVAFLLLFLVRNRRYAAKLDRASRKLSSQELAWVKQRCSGLGDRPVSSLRMHSMGRSPAVTGLVNPVLLLPHDFFTRYSPGQQVLMLEHEFQHLRRLDVLALFLARVYRCLFWFNPLVYPAERCFRLDQELSCDEKVLQVAGREQRRLYGETLLLSLDYDTEPEQLGYSPDFAHVRRRTEMLSRHRKRWGGAVTGLLLVLAATSVSVAYTVGSGYERDRLPRPREQKLASEYFERAEHQFAERDYTAALRSLKQSDDIRPDGPTPASQALRARSLIALRQWDRGLFHIERAIALTEQSGGIPERQWMLMQTALRWKLGDLDGAAQSLNKTIEYSPDRSYGATLAELNALVQESWEPLREDEAPLRF